MAVAEILRSLVRIRLEGDLFFFMSFTTTSTVNDLVLQHMYCVSVVPVVRIFNLSHAKS